MIKIKKHHEGALYILAALGISRAFNIISLPYLSTKLDPSDFADYALFITAANLLTAFMLFGFDSSLIRFLSVSKDKSNVIKIKIFTLNWLIAFISSIISIIYLYHTKLNNYSVEKIFLFGSALFLSIIFPLAQAGLRAENSYKKLFVSLFIGGIITPLITISMVSRGYLGDALIYGYVLGILGSTILATRIENYQLFILNHFNDAKLIEVLRVGLPITATAPLFWVITSLDKWVLNLYTSKTELGVYALSATLSAPYMMFVSSMLIAFQPHALTLLSSQNDIDKSEVKNELIVLIYTMLIVWIIYTLSVFLFVKYFFSSQYINIIYISPILGLAYMFNGLYQAEKIKHLYLNKITYSMYAMIVAAISATCSLFLLVPKYGHIGAALSQLFGFVTMFFIAKYFGKKYLNSISIDIQLNTVYILILSFIAGYYFFITGRLYMAIVFSLPIVAFFVYMTRQTFKNRKDKV